MKKILIAEDVPLIRDLLCMCLESIPNVEVLQAEDGKEALEIINKEKIDILISDHNMPHVTGIELYRTLLKRSERPFFVLSSGSDLETIESDEKLTEEEVSQITFLPKPFHPEQLVSVVESDIIDKDPNLVGYYKVNGDSLCEFVDLKCNVYILIGEKRPVKVLDDSAVIDKNVLNKYQSKYCPFFYLDKKGIFKYQQKLYTKMNDYLASNLNIKQENYIKDATTHQKASDIGLSEESIIIAEQAVNNTIQVLKGQKDLKSLIDQFLDISDYRQRNSMLLSYLCTEGSLHEEYQGTLNPREFASLSLMQNLCLEKSEFAKIHFLEELASLTLSPKDILNVKEHPIQIAEKLKNSRHFSSEMIFVLENHHELPNGNGFPKGLTGKEITYNSAFFIVANSIAHFILKDNEKSLNEKRIEELETLFTGHPHFLSIYHMFKGIITSV